MTEPANARARVLHTSAAAPAANAAGGAPTLLAIKESNPKDRLGVLKASMSYVSAPVLIEVSLGMMEGGWKYGRHNYRAIGVRGSVYYDAAMRHLMAWWEGEDLDPQSGAGLHHISKCIAGLTVLRDAMILGKWVDDRPPKMPDDWLEKMNAKVPVLAKAIPEPKEPFTEKPLQSQ